MTDDEIKKALECCSIDNHIGVCKECPFADVCDEDEQALQKHALDLISRQKAEIEELKKGFAADADFFASEYDLKIKSEAIKEFAERLKEYELCMFCSFPDNKSLGSEQYIVLSDYIDNLVKEMTE